MASVAGWYEDPQDATQLRYWDGAVWTDHKQPRPDGGVSTPAAGAPATATPAPMPATGFAAPAPAPVAASALPASPYVPMPAPAPAPYDTAGRSGGKGGVVVAVVVAGIVVLGVIAGAIMLLVSSGKSDSEAEASSPVDSGQTSSAEPGAEVNLNDRASTPPAGYTYPSGWVEQSNPEVGMTYAVPEKWVNLTDPYREYYEVPAETQPSGAWITYVAAWGSEGDENSGPDDIIFMHTQFDRTTSMSLFNLGQIRSYTGTDFTVEWDPSEEYISEQGIPVVKTIGTPSDTTEALQVYNWSIGGGNNGVDITCWVYTYSHGCEEVDDIIDTMWIDPS